MPIYEYACRACGHEMEIRQKFSDAPLTDCPACGTAALERLVSASSFALKGSGWYADGYGPPKSEDKPEAAKDAKDTKDTKDTKDAKEPKGGGGDAAKTEKKPAEPTKTTAPETKKAS